MFFVCDFKKYGLLIFDTEDGTLDIVSEREFCDYVLSTGEVDTDSEYTGSLTSYNVPMFYGRTLFGGNWGNRRLVTLENSCSASYIAHGDVVFRLFDKFFYLQEGLSY